MSYTADDIKSLINEAVENTKDKTGMMLNVAINYGGREEIVHAVKEIYKDIENNKISIDDVTENTITDNLYCDIRKTQEIESFFFFILLLLIY